MAFVDWLHEKGYQFNESGRIGDLTPGQLALLQGGHTFREQQREDAARDAHSQSAHSKSRRDTRDLAERKAERRT